MAQLSKSEDAFGEALLSHLEGRDDDRVLMLEAPGIEGVDHAMRLRRT